MSNLESQSTDKHYEMSRVLFTLLKTVSNQYDKAEVSKDKTLRENIIKESKRKCHQTFPEATPKDMDITLSIIADRL